MECDYSNMCSEIIKLSEEILSEEDQNAQWKVFEHFLTKHIDDNHDLCLQDRPCSKKICFLLAHKLTDFKSSDVVISNLLVYLMATLYFNNSARSNIQWISNFDRTMPLSSNLETLRPVDALRGWRWGTSYVKFLLKFGLLFRILNKLT